MSNTPLAKQTCPTEPSTPNGPLLPSLEASHLAKIINAANLRRLESARSTPKAGSATISTPKGNSALQAANPEYRLAKFAELNGTDSDSSTFSAVSSPSSGVEIFVKQGAYPFYASDLPLTFSCAHQLQSASHTRLAQPPFPLQRGTRLSKRPILSTDWPSSLN